MTTDNANPSRPNGPQHGDAAIEKLEGRPVGRRKGQYLIAMRTTPGFMPMSADSLHASLSKIEGVEVVKRIRPRGFGTMSTGGAAPAPEILVTKMDGEKAAVLLAQAKANPAYIVEHDAELVHAETPARPNFLPQFAAPTSEAIDFDFQILGADNLPLPKAMVQVYGTALPSQGTTDNEGRVKVSVFGGMVRAVYVKPAANHWEKMVLDPHLTVTEVNRIALRPLSETYPGFPEKGFIGWGQTEMQLDRANPSSPGKGVKVGIIDSGCDATHPQLRHVQSGTDFTDGGTPDSWKTDMLSHGTHCAGIIGAMSEAANGIRGFAPGAEIHALKVFPGGRSSDLIDALDQCIDLGLDVVNMSLGTESPSELVAQKIVEATSKGVACIVAAGNSGGAVQFPGSVPGVLTVSAVGKSGTFPADTAHAMTQLPGGLGDLFPAKFSCYGPKIDVCAPGVAIVSCVPGGYAAWDGTSMATPHVTGLAALVLAHHPAFQGKPKQNNAQRVAQLFAILKGAALPCVVDVTRGGAGLPNAVAATGQAAGAAGQSAAPLAPVVAYGGGAGYAAPPVAADQQQQVLSALLYNAAASRMVVQLRVMGLM